MGDARSAAPPMHNDGDDSASRRDMASVRFDGLKILVVEDEAIVSFLVEDMLLALGCAEVWQAGSVDQALALLANGRPDAAVLDVNLSGTLVYPVAERLAQLRVPFFFATGYGQNGIAPEWSQKPVIQKPFDQGALERALEAALGR
jgi:CheY-like chemotaxis protein